MPCGGVKNGFGGVRSILMSRLSVGISGGAMNFSFFSTFTIRKSFVGILFLAAIHVVPAFASKKMLLLWAW